MAPGAQTRPNLKIQEGCGNRCTFCVIPQTRGSSKSLPAAAVLRQVEGFVAAGGNELVLSGINLGRWGRDFSDSEGLALRTLAGLVREIFEQTALPRLRLSSIEPMDWDAELIGLMAEFGGRHGVRGWRVMRTCPCSRARTRCCGGCTGATGRGITRKRWKRWCAPAGPELTLGADVMVGFPGETDAEFRGDHGAGAGAALRLPAPVSVFAAAGNAGLGAARRAAGSG